MPKPPVADWLKAGQAAFMKAFSSGLSSGVGGMVGEATAGMQAAAKGAVDGVAAKIPKLPNPVEVVDAFMTKFVNSVKLQIPELLKEAGAPPIPSIEKVCIALVEKVAVFARSPLPRPHPPQHHSHSSTAPDPPPARGKPQS